MRSKAEIRNLIISLLDRDDEFWYMYTFKKELYFKKLQPQEIKDIIRKSMDTAEELKTKLNNMYQELNPVEYIDKFSLKLERTDDVINEYLYIALFSSSSKKVTINEGVLKLIGNFIGKNELQDVIQIAEIEKTAIMHELFHHIEDETPGIYTRSKMIDRKLLNMFNHKISVRSSSEIGAIHFSKLMRGLNYSPCIYEVLILLMSGNDSVVYDLLGL
jgi:hypothetical protein